MKKRLLILAALVLVLVVVLATPALAYPYATYCGPWNITWFRGWSGLWFWQWYHWCYNPFGGWFIQWGAWGR